ncbi:MAG TPA: gamma carbonic anhydrase family protein [Acidimicrobiales bacterium]|nr:gamma carbonic anhydrase family protein [Acidimicrobiales bacterium]
MPVYALGDLVPSIDPEAFVHPDAVVIGAVSLAAGSSLWPGAVLRGDYGAISVGEGTSVQDGCVLHADEGLPTVVGGGCIVGHLAHLEGCIVEDGCLIGVGSIVLRRAIIERGATVAAGAVVLQGTRVPAGRLAAGVPARIGEGGLSPEEIREGVGRYLSEARRYREEMRRLR